MQSIESIQHTSIGQSPILSSAMMIQDLELNLNRLDEEESNLLLLKTQLLKIKKITEEKNKKDEMIAILNKRVSTLEYEKDRQAKNNQELTNIITERIETLEGLIVEKDMYLLQFEQQCIASNSKYDLLKKDYDDLLELNRKETESHLSTMKICDENRIEIHALKSKIQQNETNMQNTLHVFDNLKVELQNKETVITQEKNVRKKTTTDLSAKLLTSQHSIERMSNQILLLENKQEDLETSLSQSMQENLQLKATNQNLMIDLDKWTNMYVELERIMKILKQQITVSQQGYSEELVDIKTELTTLRQNKIELDMLQVEHIKCRKELQTYENILNTIPSILSTLRLIKIPNSLGTQATLLSHRNELNALADNTRKYIQDQLSEQAIAASASNTNTSTYTSTNTKNTSVTFHFFTKITEFVDDLFSKSFAYQDLLIEQCNLFDVQESKYQQTMKELKNMDTFIDSLNYRIESMNLLFQMNPRSPQSDQRIATTISSSNTQNTLNHINQTIHQHISNILDNNADYKIITTTYHDDINNINRVSNNQDTIQARRLKAIEHLKKNTDSLFNLLESNQKATDILYTKDNEYQEQITNAKSDVSYMKEHYGNEILRLQRLSEEALHAVEVTEYEAKHEIERLKNEYQIKFDEETNRYEESINRLEKDNKTIEDAMIHNRNKIFQLQDIINALEDRLRTKEREISRIKAIETKQQMTIIDLEKQINQQNHIPDSHSYSIMSPHHSPLRTTSNSNNSSPSRSSQLLHEIHSNLNRIPSSYHSNTSYDLSQSSSPIGISNRHYQDSNNSFQRSEQQLSALDLSLVSKEEDEEEEKNNNNNNLTNHLANKNNNNNNSYESTLANATNTAYLQRQHIPTHHAYSYLNDSDTPATSATTTTVAGANGFSPELIFSPTYEVGFNTHWKRNHRIDISMDSNHSSNILNTSTHSSSLLNNIQPQNIHNQQLQNTLTQSHYPSACHEGKYNNNTLRNVDRNWPPPSQSINRTRESSDAYEIYSDIGKLTRKIEFNNLKSMSSSSNYKINNHK